jgi:cytochrome P450
MSDQETLPLDQSPYLDISDPNYSIRSPEVRAARDNSWYARTPYGLAVLRYEEMSKLLIHKSLRQGSHAWPELSGVSSGLFADWWKNTILVTEGQDHRRLRRLVNPAFSPKTVKGLMENFERITNELIDTFIDKVECDFMAEFADPYAARILSHLIGLPKEVSKDILDLSSEMGLALGVTFKSLT